MTLKGGLSLKKPSVLNEFTGREFSSGLFLSVMALMGFGLVQVYSSSFMHASETYGDGLYFFKRQLAYSILAVGLFFVGILLPPGALRKLGPWLWLTAGLGVVFTLIPHLGVKVGGASRWLRLPGGLRFEPSELLKVAFPLFLAALACWKESSLARWPKIFTFCVMFLPPLLLLKQPDFGSFVILGMTAFIVLFAFGLKWRWMIGLGLGLGLSFYFLVMQVPYRKARVIAFLDPWSDAEQKGFQIIQSLLSFHSGGLTGVGLGQGQGKLFFLPEAHTDFTLAVLGEELGFVGLFVLLLLYGSIVYRALQLSFKFAESKAHKFEKTFCLGTGTLFGLSVFINSGVALGLLPTKGLTLPFLSYGGSSLVCVAFLMGLLINMEQRLPERIQRKPHPKSNLDLSSLKSTFS